MADLASTMRSAMAITGHNDVVVPAFVLIELRRQREERRKRALATILGQAEVAGN
jgi:hypothetical protein